MKFFKKNDSKKKFKKIAASSYEVIDFTLESPRDILSLTGSGIVGSSMQAQKVSRMIIMVSKNDTNAPSVVDLNHFASFDLMVWNMDDRDVYYVAGSMSNFYAMCVSYMSRHISDSFTDYVIHALLEANYICRDKYAASLFTDEQLDYFKSISMGEPVLVLTEDYRKKMVQLIDSSYMIRYELFPVKVSIDNPDKATIMSMAKFSLVGKDNILVYANARQIATITEVLGEDVREPISLNESEQNDMIATEVVE